MLLENLEFR